MSENPNQPCLVLKWPDGSVMLDCALDLPSNLAVLPSITVFGKIMNARKTILNCNCTPAVNSKTKSPKFAICIFQSDLFNMSDLSVILLSHSCSFLALPFITERTAFNGAIFASEPTVQFGWYCPVFKHNLHSSYFQSVDAGACRVFFRKRDCLWEDFYTQEDVKCCLSKVQTIGLNDGFGYVTATCSGYSIGSCNWVIETGSEKVTLRSGGNVLIPCVPCGLTFDLLESLFSQIGGYDLSSVPVFLVSEVARNCLAYANIYAEWLSEGKIARAFIPDDPFLHGTVYYQLVFAGSISREIKSPCVVFASHPSLRIGDVVHFMTIWKDDPANTIVITDPDYATNDILLPFLPMKMKVRLEISSAFCSPTIQSFKIRVSQYFQAVFCPIDTRLTADQIGQITAKFLSAQLNIPDYTFGKVAMIICGRLFLRIFLSLLLACNLLLKGQGIRNSVPEEVVKACRRPKGKGKI
ncbi:Integrator complex subunit 9 [Trichuris trichiura]|uniref:Integrator complex subunit 9 n=1 Tax=Trichuris trichiura TaxID=36087 RepID=A0A077ZIS7_TRITR|nr:Integrator complex subunit 9 [Trichuris trichiura]